MGISAVAFGEHDGQRVDQFTLTSETGAAVDILSYGVVVRDWRVPLATGPRSVVLGFEHFAAYPAHSPYFGALVGRVANRIGGGVFEMDGHRYQLATNEGAHTLHGGPQGLGRLVWAAEIDSRHNAVVFTLRSPDGAMGFPGVVDFTAIYSLAGNRLRLELAARPDRKTPISMVQHQYFNLGTGPDILDHSFQMLAGAYTEVDAELIPTGAILPVAGTQYDFRVPRTLRDKAGRVLDYDTNLVLDRDRDRGLPVATVTAPGDGPRLRLWTDRPGLQFYNGIYTDVPVPGLGGHRYGRYSGFCLEDQMFPDAVHHRHFPPIWHNPDHPYTHWCEIEIG